MNIYVKLFLTITTIFYLVVSFWAWDFTWVATCGVPPRLAFFAFDLFFFIGGAISLEDYNNTAKRK